MVKCLKSLRIIFILKNKIPQRALLLFLSYSKCHEGIKQEQLIKIRLFWYAYQGISLETVEDDKILCATKSSAVLYSALVCRELSNQKVTRNWLE